MSLDLEPCQGMEEDTGALAWARQPEAWDGGDAKALAPCAGPAGVPAPPARHEPAGWPGLAAQAPSLGSLPPAVHPAARPQLSASALTWAAAAGLTASLSACGGGGGGSPSPAPTPAPVPAPGPTPAPPPPPTSPTLAEAARFLSQATLGGTKADVLRVQSLGYSAWLDEQMAMPLGAKRWDWLVANGFGVEANRTTQQGFDNAAWHTLITHTDALRQRMVMALSEILVVSIDGLVSTGFKQFLAAGYLDLLDQHAFGNYRSLLGAVSTSPAMGVYLTFRNNLKANADGSNLPDENYAREVMQLFSIGLLQLNLDGTPKLSGSSVQETYSNDDVTGMARVFTGWVYDTSANTVDAPYAFAGRPMVQNPLRCEFGEKRFLGVTIPAGQDGVASMKVALDTLFQHANTPPFVCRQLIQRLVTSNPSPAYVQRVAQVFVDNGQGVRGDLKAVLKAILLDTEARSASGLQSPTFGKLREPVLRLLAWARAGRASSTSGLWRLGNTSDPGTRLGQSPLRAPSVFNFFRPGYVPPNSAVSQQGLVAPEFQVTNESSVVGYVNFMQQMVSGTAGVPSDVRADDSAWLALVGDTKALLDEMNLVIAAGQLSSASLSVMQAALDTMPTTSDLAKSAKVWAALTLVLSAPEFLVQK